MQRCCGAAVITPEAMAAFAAKHGWRMERPVRDYADFWWNPDNDRLIKIPRHDRIADYHRAVADFVEDMSVELGVKKREVKRELGWRDPRIEALQDQVRQYCGGGLKDEAALSVLDAIDAAGERL